MRDKIFCIAAEDVDAGTPVYLVKRTWKERLFSWYPCVKNKAYRAIMMPGEIHPIKVEVNLTTDDD